MVVDVSDEEIKSLTQSILVRYGIDFTCYEPKSLKRRIIRVMNLFHFTSIHELWIKFLSDRNFVHEFMNQISVGMTSMFRDPVLWKSLKKRMLTDYQVKTSVSIWHAGCSTGEEVNSLGILLRETALSDKAIALATDFNQSAIEEAKRGVYHKIKMIENETNYREISPFHDFSKYYDPTDGKHVKMDSNLIKHSTFKYHNLITDTYPTGFDMVFCRNVMIYFDNIAKAKILNQFHASLNPGGVLIIGFFDTMSHLMDNDKFQLIDESAKIFQKK